MADLTPCPFCGAEALTTHAWKCTTFRHPNGAGPDYNRGVRCWERVAMAAIKAREEMAERLKVDGRPIRPEVLWFAQQMERKLRENEGKGGWAACRAQWLWERMMQESRELKGLLDMKSEQYAQRGHLHECIDDVIAEAADVANFAMMIADVAHQNGVLNAES